MQEPSSHKGMPYRRFRGRSGFVVGKRGKAYIVEIQDGNTAKKIISRAEHLKAI
jgi:large subunit ribosomal protein L21e